MKFSPEFSDADIRERCSSVKEGDVKLSLSRAKCGPGDFLRLISPAASGFLPELREKAAKLKRMYFGRTVKLYTPIYISNFCINDCMYCGFRQANPRERRRLSHDELMREAEIVKGFGIDSILLVSGEDPESISLDFLEKAVAGLHEKFSYIALEVYPFDVDGYRRLFNAGAAGLAIYQETYSRELYGKLHGSGPKKDYDYRLDAPFRAAKAGFYNLGIGSLLGLNDWRIEAAFLASHASWLMKNCWKSKIQFSFPRITPAGKGFKIPAPVEESGIEQMMLAFRIAFPECDISISTRESREFRNRMSLVCASQISAASSVVPGGYAKPEKGLGQFQIHDVRTVSGLDSDLKALGLEPVYKDWDRCFS